MTSTFNQMRTCWALVCRDVRFIVASLPGRLIDGCIIVIMQTLVIGKFLPLLGMPQELIGPLFIGMITQIVFSSAYGIAFRQANDLKKTKFINYQLALPLNNMWLFGQIIFSFMIEVAFISLPLIALGSIFLSTYFTIQTSSLMVTGLMYILSLLIYSTLFIYFVYQSEYTWFLDNVWARRLTPLFFFGCGYYTWKKLYAFNNSLGLLTLLNPITYLHEGLRNVLLGGNEFIPLWICMLMSVLFCALLMFGLKSAIKRRLDPV
ncbi:hypothetical protein BH09DEP1_BH09DEP1_2310 [soil metagenome]